MKNKENKEKAEAERLFPKIDEIDEKNKKLQDALKNLCAKFQKDQKVFFFFNFFFKNDLNKFKFSKKVSLIIKLWYFTKKNFN